MPFTAKHKTHSVKGVVNLNKNFTGKKKSLYPCINKCYQTMASEEFFLLLLNPNIYCLSNDKKQVHDAINL